MNNINTVGHHSYTPLERNNELPVFTRKADERIKELEAENALIKAENENWRKNGSTLFEIQARAVEAAIKECGCNDDNSICFVRDLREFAQKLRGEI